MDKIEEVANKIRLSYDPVRGFLYSYEDIAKQICQLMEPKPETEIEAYFRGREDGMTIKEFQTKPSGRLQQYDPNRLIKDEDKMAMSDIKNRWLHSSGAKTTFEHDCIDEIIYVQRGIQDAKTASIKETEIKELERHKDLIDAERIAFGKALNKAKAECQARIEALIELMREALKEKNERLIVNNIKALIAHLEKQAFKATHLGGKDE